MTTTATYEIHPLADLMPAMAPEDFAKLRDDIAAHGLYEAITLYENKILDGRHRYRACAETGTEPRFFAYTGTEPAAYVVSLNVQRRHLTISQRAMLAEAFMPELREEAHRRIATAGASSAPGRPSETLRSSAQGFHRAADDAAELVGVSTRAVYQAQRVQRDDPELAEKVRAGEVSLNAAEQQLIARDQTHANGIKPRNPIKQHAMPPANEVVPKVIDGLRVHIKELARALSEGTATAEEAADWSRDLSEIRTALSRSLNHLKELH